MSVDFYYTPGSPPCRTVLLTAKALGLEMNTIMLDLEHGEHLKPEYGNINPQRTVPTLVDGDLILSESRAISVYLVQAYGKDDSLFPMDPKKQAKINQVLQFDLGSLYPAFVNQYFPWIFAGVPKSDDREKKIYDALEILNFFLASSTWVAGDFISVADFSLVATVSTLEVIGVNLKRYANVTEWLTKSKNTIVGYQEINQSDIDEIKSVLADILKK